MPDLLIVDGETVRHTLDMKTAIDLMGDALRSSSSEEAVFPARSTANNYDKTGALLLMPAASSREKNYGLKVVSLHPDNANSGTPTIQGFVSLFDAKSGAPVAIIEAASLTAIRTAAASGHATDFLARKDVRTHAILGTGVQARTHAEAIAAVRPSIEQTRIWGRSKKQAMILARDLEQSLDMDIAVTDDLKDACRADIISTVTASETPIVFGVDVLSGAHINLVGSHSPKKREADSNTIVRGRVYVDHHASALKEAGDIIMPIEEGVFRADDIVGEIGAVSNGSIAGRINAEEITIYKSLGNAAQDLVAANAILEKILDNGVGVTVQF